MKKKFVTLALALVMACSLAIPAGATLSEADNDKTVVVTNEYDAYVQMNALSDKELQNEGLSTQQIENIRNVTYEEAFSDR